MKISDIATVRTGLVTARKKKSATSEQVYNYKLLNLKCIADEGYIVEKNIEPYQVSEKLKEDYLTQMGDILIKLSVPYTAIIINKLELCGFVIPSHFAIVRTNREFAVPEYIFWSLKRDKNKINLMQNSSVGTVFGTISSGMIANLSINVLPLKKQQVIGEMMILSEKEQELLSKLTEEKKKYNTILLDKFYEEMKRGNNQ